MINELQTKSWVEYTQKLRNPKTDYEKRKVQKDRKKALLWLNLWLKEQEIILQYYDSEDNIITCFASSTTDYEVKTPFPDTPLTKEIVHGETVFEDQYIRFYKMPESEPIALHIDKVYKWYVPNDNVLKLSKQFGELKDV